MNRTSANVRAGVAVSVLLTILCGAGCASDESVKNASGDKRTVRQAEPLRDVRQYPPTVTGAPR